MKGVIWRFRKKGGIEKEWKNKKESPARIAERMRYFRKAVLCTGIGQKKNICMFARIIRGAIHTSAYILELKFRKASWQIPNSEIKGLKLIKCLTFYGREDLWQRRKLTIAETARQTDSKLELDEYEIEKLNAKLQYLENADEEYKVVISYFVSDKKKSGGAYVSKSGVVIKVREYERDVVMDDGTKIPIDDIYSISGSVFDTTEEI